MELSKLKNKDFSLISRDCIGGVLYHQFGQRFLSPTINLFFTIEDFNYFCRYLNKYIKAELSECKNSGVDYPVGVLTPKSIFRKLKPIKVGFMHYDSFENAKAKWEERKSRINYQNILVINSCCYSTEVDSLTKKDIEEWNKVKYPKIILVDKSYGFNDEFVVKKPQECEEFAWLLYQNDKNDESRRVFNDFDFISFINKNSK